MHPDLKLCGSKPDCIASVHDGRRGRRDRRGETKIRRLQELRSPQRGGHLPVCGQCLSGHAPPPIEQLLKFDYGLHSLIACRVVKTTQFAPTPGTYHTMTLWY